MGHLDYHFKKLRLGCKMEIPKECDSGAED